MSTSKGHIDAIHEGAVVVEWRNDIGEMMDSRDVAEGRLVRTAVIDMVRGANLAEGDTITVKPVE